jgi:hypothetical protein
VDGLRSERPGNSSDSADNDGSGEAGGLGPLAQRYSQEVSDIQERLARARKEPGRSLVAIVGLLAISAVTLTFALLLHSRPGGWALAGEVILWLFSGVCWLFVVVGLATYANERHEAREVARDLRAAQERAGLVAPDEGADYFERLVAINLTNLSDYYRLVRLHAGRSFVLAASASAFGFALILAALAVSLALRPDAQSIGYVGAAAGTVTEMVAAVFFVLYSRTIRQLKDYHDSLLQVQNVLLGLKMVESVADPETRAELTSAVLSSLLDKASSPVAGSDHAVAPSPAALVQTVLKGRATAHKTGSE